MMFRYMKNWSGLIEIKQRIVGEISLYSAIKTVSIVKIKTEYLCLKG